MQLGIVRVLRVLKQSSSWARLTVGWWHPTDPCALRAPDPPAPPARIRAPYKDADARMRQLCACRQRGTAAVCVRQRGTCRQRLGLSPPQRTNTAAVTAATLPSSLQVGKGSHGREAQPGPTGTTSRVVPIRVTPLSRNATPRSARPGPARPGPSRLAAAAAFYPPALLVRVTFLAPAGPRTNGCGS